MCEICFIFISFNLKVPIEKLVFSLQVSCEKLVGLQVPVQNL